MKSLKGTSYMDIKAKQQSSKEPISPACEKCNKHFDTKIALHKHSKIHQEKTFVCEECGRKFALGHQLKGHLLIHSGVKTFACEYCTQMFYQKYDLNMHLRTHTGEKPYICEVCGKGFTQKVHLLGHQVSHTGKKPFSCDVCLKNFVLKSSLQRHQQVHLGIRPFKCKLCDKNFARKSILQQHMWDVHEKRKPFQCSSCGSKFSQKGNWQIHMQGNKCTRSSKKRTSKNKEAKRTTPIKQSHMLISQETKTRVEDITVVNSPLKTRNEKDVFFMQFNARAETNIPTSEESLTVLKCPMLFIEHLNVDNFAEIAKHVSLINLNSAAVAISFNSPSDINCHSNLFVSAGSPMSGASQEQHVESSLIKSNNFMPIECSFQNHKAKEEKLDRSLSFTCSSLLDHTKCPTEGFEELFPELAV